MSFTSPSDKTVPAKSSKAVTPDDVTTLPDGPCRSLFIGTGGDVTAIAVGDDAAVLYKNLPDGSYLNVQVKAVLDTGTTATDIVALY